MARYTWAACALDELAAEFGTPAFVLDESALRARARAYADGLTSRWPKGRVVFASKALPVTAVQRVMVQEGLGLDVAGGGEHAIKAGVDPALVVLHGNAKSDEEIALACEHRVGLIVVDNADDVDRLEAHVPAGTRQDVLVRVIPEVTAATHASVLTGHEGSKFGVPKAQVPALLAHPWQRPTAPQGPARPRGLADHGARALGGGGRSARGHG